MVISTGSDREAPRLPLSIHEVLDVLDIGVSVPGFLVKFHGDGSIV